MVVLSCDCYLALWRASPALTSALAPVKGLRSAGHRRRVPAANPLRFLSRQVVKSLRGPKHLVDHRLH